ncbi:tyrosine--tRNA ligase [Candidatus Bathyarchaeota archaeon]|nr:tyrosine--tRNA ligase [Candidatus Bathyarchaeota archaeon]
MDVETRLELVTKNTAEIVTITELKTLLETKQKPRAYWGFECSGLMHLGMGLVCGTKIKNMIDANFEFIIFLADWHSWINNKLGGEMEKIRIAGEYFKHCFTALGINPNRVKYLWASDLVKDVSYWEKVIRIAKSASLQRTWRALPIMGREMSLVDVETAWVYYPCMQVADIFQMELDVACAGIDQRKAHMLARDIAEKHNRMKPICVHTPLLMGLSGPKKKEKLQFDENSDINAQISSKMSKSVPVDCIYIHDSPDTIRLKIQNAYCPPKEIQGNPVLEIARHVVFPANLPLDVARLPKYGGPITFNNYQELETAYRNGKIHPLDLKNGVTEALVKLLTPVREYFQRHPDPLENMMRIEVTR